MKSWRSCAVHLDSSSQNYIHIKVAFHLFRIDVPFDRITSIVIIVSADLSKLRKKKRELCFLIEVVNF